MKKNKGFTLIELLTVIAILAVILLIAAPTILGVLDKAKRSTFKNQVLMYVEGLKNQVALNEIGQEQNITWTNNEATVDFSNINMDSANNYTGKIKVTKNSKNEYTYTVIEAHGDGWKLKTSKEAASIIDSDIVKDDGKSTEAPAVTPKAYKIGDSVTLKDGTTWHVIEASDSNTETVTLFADQNIKNDASGWTTVQSEYAIAFDTSNSNVYASSSLKTIVDDNVKEYISNSLTNAGGTAIKSIRLITTDEICNIINNVDSSNNCVYPSDGSELILTKFVGNISWIYSTYYWSMTPHATDSNIVYGSNVNGYFGNIYANNNAIDGIRPVIVTLKSNIK